MHIQCSKSYSKLFETIMPKMNDTQSFPSILKQQTPRSLDEEYVSYDVESLFTNIPVEETISYFINEIY